MMMDNQYSMVWLGEDDWVYKRQHEFMTDNEFWCLMRLEPSGYVPEVQQVDRDLIRTRYIQRIPTVPVMREELLSHETPILKALSAAGIRHGDLTEYAVVLGPYNHPYIIDFAESRLAGDPRPDKRPEGDAYWLNKTLNRIVEIYNAQR